MSDAMPDTTTEAILEAARKRWPDATSYEVRTLAWVNTGDVRYYEDAPDLTALLAKLKGEGND